MMATEVSLSWSEVEQTLEKLTVASRTFDCAAVIEILKSSPLGYTPAEELEDLVWRGFKSPAPELEEPTTVNGDKVRVLY